MRRSRLLSLLGVSSTVAAAAVAIPFLASSAPAGYDWPDLVSSVPTITPSTVYLEQNNFGQGTRLLLRFDGFIDNVGDGPVDFQGNPSAHNVRQYVRPDGGGALVPAPGVAAATSADPFSAQCKQTFPTSVSPTLSPCITFDSTDSHNHWHLVDAARYTLVDQAGNVAAPGSKVGFCLYDISTAANPPAVEDNFYGTTPDTDTFCEQYNPNAQSIREGISVGRRDVYHAGLAYQWVDVSNTRPGVYRLGSEVDPSNRIVEKNETNNAPAYINNVIVPGWVAKPAAAGTGLGQSVAVTLPAPDRFGNANFPAPANADLRFVITGLPSKGTLRNGAANLVVGSVIDPPGSNTSHSITYVPNANSTGGVDTFTYAAIDNASAFPTSPTSATASVTVGSAQPVAVAVSGNPASMVVGTSVQLTGTVSNAAPGVTWSVNGVAGGNAAVGTVSATGLYTAPAAVPAGGSVTVRATSTALAAAFGEATIGITAAPPRVPAPTPFTPPGTTAGSGKVRIAVPGVARFGRRVAVKVVPRHAGRLGITIFRGRTVLGRCTVRRTVPGRSVVCNVRLRKGTPRIAVRVVAVLSTSKGTARAVATRKRL